MTLKYTSHAFHTPLRDFLPCPKAACHSVPSWTDHFLWGSPVRKWSLEANAAQTITKLMKKYNNEASSVALLSLWVLQKPKHPLSNSSAQPLPSWELWLPLAVPPYFLVNALHNALTLPVQSHSKDTKLHLRTSISLSKSEVYSLHLPLGHHLAPQATAEQRISYLLLVALPTPPSPQSQPRQPPSSSQQSLQKRTLPCKMNM